MNKILTKQFYLVLLPIFFVLHGFLENFGFVSVKNAAILVVIYSAMSLAICLFSYFFFRDFKKASLITVIWLIFFFFFAALHDWLKFHSPIRLFHRYSFLLTISILLLVWLFIFLKKTSIRFYRFSLFLNVLLIIYIVIDIAGIVWKSNDKNQSRLSVYSFAQRKEFTICDTCNKPDIYFLLFDEYGSTISLKEQYNCINNIDSFLISKGFSVQEQSHSNYNFTPFSMSSILNMSYIDGIKNVKSVTADDYANSTLLVRDNQVINFLDAHNYEILNLSMFDLAGHPATVDQSFLPLKTKLITDRTLFAHMNKDIGWLLITKFPFNLFTKTNYLQHLYNNERFLKEAKEISKTRSEKPRFIYAHYYMPHPPFFFDKHGNRKDNKTLFEENIAVPPAAYCEYLVYTNRELRSLISTIQANDPKAVIILMGDHGLRGVTANPYPYHFFQNLNAVYFPDKNYTTLYDSISGVNQFRVVFNKLFNQTLPILKDSSILLRDQQKNLPK